MSVITFQILKHLLKERLLICINSSHLRKLGIINVFSCRSTLLYCLPLSYPFDGFHFFKASQSQVTIQNYEMELSEAQRQIEALQVQVNRRAFIV